MNIAEGVRGTKNLSHTQNKVSFTSKSFNPLTKKMGTGENIISLSRVTNMGGKKRLSFNTLTLTSRGKTTSMISCARFTFTPTWFLPS